MTVSLSKEPTNLHPHTFDDEELLGIGRVIRAAAEIEELANLYTQDLLELKPWQAFLILGKMPTSGRLRLAETAAKARGEEAIKTHQECFGEKDYKDIIKFRNTVAHGLLLGKTDNGKIAFFVQETAGADEFVVYASVNAYSPNSFSVIPQRAEDYAEWLEARLKLQASRRKFREQGLLPHPKAPRSKKPKTGVSGPPQSSRG